MRAVLLAVTLLFAACAPIVQDQRAPGVTLTAVEHEGYVTYRVDARDPLDRLFLRFVGDDLEANAPECSLVAGALECVVGSVTAFYEVSISGTVTNDWALPAGVACRDDCYPLYLTP